MIIIYHRKNKVVEVLKNKENLGFSGKKISKIIIEIAKINPEDLIIWCDLDLVQNLNLTYLDEIFHHKRILASYNPYGNSYLQDAIGYVEESVFIKINKKVSYPTWQMSSCVGGIYALMLLELESSISQSEDFDYFLHSLSKIGMAQGLFCYSEPLLLNKFFNEKKTRVASTFTLFQFVKQHYKTRWIFLLFLNLLIHERKIAFFPLVISMFYKKRSLEKQYEEKVFVQSTREIIKNGSIDVIIPTIGRKKCLYDVLKDLSLQTYLPINVIIVEQNPDPESSTDLDYILNEIWPFKIKHIFIHKAGACNARNLALTEVKSEWVFLNDDDNRFDSNLIEKVFTQIKKYGSKVVSTSYLQLNEIKSKKISNQSSNFGSGNSFIHSSLLHHVNFNEKFEFGYGEDSDFGMQLRNIGADNIYCQELEILHLKAPMGGFRIKPILEWQNDVIQPKPSPTVMLYKILHLTKQQIKGYQTILFFKFYRLQSIKNPIQYLIYFKKQWNQSIYWANKLNNGK